MAAVVDAELYRPTHHFSPKRGWMNDPNGLIRIDGVWHAFFQYFPDGTTHGRMHWGHAKTSDLITWIEQPIALYPDSNGTCFSGSAIETSAGDVELFYTAHRVDGNGEDVQTQCMALASRDMLSFSKDLANPVIPNPGLRAFRDPKVIWHEPTARWIMVLTHGQSIGFYSSVDRKSWSLESTFGEMDGRHSIGPWECPDLVEMKGPDGRLYWVLIVGLGEGAFGGGSGTQYFVGEFDGYRFQNQNAPETTLWLDHGRDFYAAQSFFDRRDRRPLVLAWASNWQYARQTPTGNFRGSFSLPRRLSLLQTLDGLRLRSVVPPEVVAAFEELDVESGHAVPKSGAYRFNKQVAPGQKLSVSLFSEALPKISFGPSENGEWEVRLRRLPLEETSDFGHDYSVRLFAGGSALDVEVFVDSGLMEVCVDGGVVWLTCLNFPGNPRGSVRIGA